MNLQPPFISVVTPVYKAEACLDELCRRLVSALEPLTSNFEIILVEDASPDRCWETIVRLVAAEPRCKGLRLSRNFGQHYAITAGLEQAAGDWVVVMDCDLQDQPEEIPRLYAKAQEGFDTVFGRRCRRQDSRLKVLRGDICTWIYDYFTGLDTDRAIANFSISHRKVIDAVCMYRERDRSFPSLVFMTGFRRATIDVEHAARPSGKTSYTWGKLTKFALQTLVSGTNRPLHASIKFGLVLAAASLVYAVSRLIQFSVTGVAVPGWTTLAFLVSFFSGLLFMQLGIIGLYLGKVFDESKRRPLYHVAETFSPSPPS